MIDGLKDEVVIVTGGAHGIGKAYALAFAKAGAQVVIADIDHRTADQVAAEIGNNTEASALALRTDVSNEASTKDMAARTLERFGRIDVLINNAAVFSVVPMNRGRIETIDPEEWDRLMAVNLRGLFFCCRAVLPTMRKQKSGKIITIASGTVFAGAPGRIHYVTSKAATIGFTRTLAREVGDDNINVNCLAPGQHAFGRKSDGTNDQVPRIVGRTTRAQAHSDARRRRRCDVVPGLAAERFHHRPDHQRRRRHIVPVRELE